jgi:PBP1b-binding outer membrane lipoprotein LpoB
MRKPTRVVAATVLACVLSACSGGNTPDPAAPASEEPRTLQGRVLQDAQDVANQLEQRQADLESMVP